MATGLLTGMMAFATSLAAQMPGQPPNGKRLPHPEIPPPVVPAEAVSWWLVAAGILVGLLLLTLVACLLFLRRSAPVEIPPTPLKLAMSKLELLQKQVEQFEPSEIAHRVSVILRDYLQARYAVPAISRTTEELYGSSAIQAREGLRERFGPVAELYDRLEFAPQPSNRSDSEMLIGEAIRALREEKRYAPGMSPPSLPQSPPSLPFMPTKM